MDSLLRFHRGVRKLPIGWQIWLLALVMTNMIVPLFYITHPEAQMSLGLSLLGGFIGITLVKIQGFTKLLGLMHLPWFFLVYYLWTRLSLHPAESTFGIWIRAAILLSTLSLVIDAIDVFRYIKGDRKAVNTDPS